MRSSLACAGSATTVLVQQLPYDEDELIRRLRDLCRCTVTKESPSLTMRGTKGGAHVVQVFKIERGGEVATLRVRDDARPLFDYEVESPLRQLRMPTAEARTHFRWTSSRPRRGSGATVASAEGHECEPRQPASIARRERAPAPRGTGRSAELDARSRRNKPDTRWKRRSPISV